MRETLAMGLAERTVTVNREQLLETLRANREKHIREYEDSMQGYKQLAKARLEKLRLKAVAAIDDNFFRLQDQIAKADLTPGDDDESDELPNTIVLCSTMSFSLEVPKNHASAYDVAIDMAVWETRPEIELLQSHFQCFVRDDWDWKGKFANLNKQYTAAAARRG